MKTPKNLTSLANLTNLIHKPWGHERIIAKTDAYVVKEIYVKPNSRLSLQYHEKKTETMFLVDGEGYIEQDISDINSDWEYAQVALVKLVPKYIPPLMRHRLFTKDKDCLVVEISSTELEDICRVEDDYGRTQE
jgi:hypothetical protein